MKVEKRKRTKKANKIRYAINRVTETKRNRNKYNVDETNKA